MRIAILANDRASFVKPMAEGLARMVTAAGGQSQIFYDGLAALGSVKPPVAPSLARTVRRTIRRAAAPLLGHPPLYALARQLRHFDAVVVVGSLPWAYYKSFFWDSLVRSLIPGCPIVLYDLFYLPTRGLWGQWLRDGNPAAGIEEGGHWGVERYDWYLLASVASECPLPAGSHPYTLIGVNLEDETLRPEKNREFLALLDFEHPEDLSERAIQIAALERTGTRYIVLNGAYSTEEIRRIYRRCAIYFLAMRESFGFPICEVQACGGYVFTPHRSWCPSHCRKADLSRPGLGETLSSNFVVYDNDPSRLVGEIERVRASFDPRVVLQTFRQEDPQYYYGNQGAVSEFLELVRSGQVHDRLHLDHRRVQMPTADQLAQWTVPESGVATGRILPAEAAAASS